MIPPLAARALVLRPAALIRTRALATPTVALWVAAALGVAVRLRPLLADFPLNDGGFFYAIVRDIERAGIPDRLSYNGLDLPFAYAPLGFYLAALVHALGVGLLDVFRLLPAVLSVLALLAFIRFARTVTKDPVLTAIAAFGFALVPNAYATHVTGGGLPRVLGVLFLLLALERFVVLYQTRRRGALVAAGVFGALALASHAEMGWALAFSTVVLWLYRGRTRRSFVDSALAAGVAALVASPWLVTSVLRYGPAPFLSALGTGTLDNPVASLLTFRQTGEPWFPLFAALAVVGMVRVAGRGDWWLPAWLLAIGLLDSRSFFVLSTIPMSLLVAVAVRDVLAPLVESRRLRVALASAAVAYGLVTTPAALPEIFRSVPPADRAAMGWARANTAADARFLVLSGRYWSDDSVGEWFPALAERRSVVTVQGYEWLPNGAFWTQMRRSYAAESCTSQDTACLDRLRASGMRFDYVYIVSEKIGERQDQSDEPCCSALRLSLASDPRYELVYAGGGALIYRVR